MKRLLIFLAALSAGTPALATGGLQCRTAGARPIELSLIIGHTAVPSVAMARLTDDGRPIAVKVAQSWLDPAEVRLDLTDRNAVRHELRLRAKANGRHYDGSIWRNGVRRWVRCREA